MRALYKRTKGKAKHIQDDLYDREKMEGNNE